MNDQKEKHYINLLPLALLAVPVGGKAHPYPDDQLEAAADSIDLSAVHPAILTGWLESIALELESKTGTAGVTEALPETVRANLRKDALFTAKVGDLWDELPGLSNEALLESLDRLHQEKDRRGLKGVAPEAREGRYLNVTGVLSGHENVWLSNVMASTLITWLSLILAEVEERSPGWRLIRMPPATLLAEGSYEPVVHGLDSGTLVVLAELILDEVTKRGIALGGTVASAPGHLAARLFRQLPDDPGKALPAFIALGQFCGAIVEHLREQLASGVPSAAELFPEPTADEEVPQPPVDDAELQTTWRSLRVWARPNEAIGQKQTLITNPADVWRWLDMMRLHGTAPLATWGLEVRDRNFDDLLLEQGLPGPFGETRARTAHGSIVIDWEGFPTDVPSIPPEVSR